MEVWGPLLSALLGLTTMTVSGIFVFMTFRIDRGARQEAQETAKNETERLVGIAAKDAIQKESRSAVSQITEETNEQVKNQIAEAHGDINKYVTVVEDRTKAQIKEAGAAVARIEGMVRDADNKVEKRVAEARTSLDARVKDITEEIGQRVTASIDRMEERITSIHGEIKDIRASIEDIDQRLSRLEPPSEVEG